MVDYATISSHRLSVFSAESERERNSQGRRKRPTAKPAGAIVGIGDAGGRHKAGGEWRLRVSPSIAILTHGGEQSGDVSVLFVPDDER